MPRLKDKYTEEVVPKLREELGEKNILALPRLQKAVINVGAGDAKDDPGLLNKILENIMALSGQKPVVTKAKKSIAGFKVSRGHAVGVRVTVRGDRMYQFLDKLMTVVLPKVRDFRGVPGFSFDNQGNFSLGLREQGIFPEVSFQSSAERLRGLEITIVTTARNREAGRRLLELLGMPFKKGDSKRG